MLNGNLKHTVWDAFLYLYCHKICQRRRVMYTMQTIFHISIMFMVKMAVHENDNDLSFKSLMQA